MKGGAGCVEGAVGRVTCGGESGTCGDRSVV